jgi:hypothetical protein
MDILRRPKRRDARLPDETAPLIFEVGVCHNCLVDCVMRRFREVKHGRMVQLARDMTAATNAIQEARKNASWEAYERNFDDMRHKRTPNPEIEAEAARKLAEEEESIARQHDMCPGWSCDELERDYQQAWRERRR